MAPRYLTQALRARDAVARITGATISNPRVPFSQKYPEAGRYRGGMTRKSEWERLGYSDLTGSMDDLQSIPGALAESAEEAARQAYDVERGSPGVYLHEIERAQQLCGGLPALHAKVSRASAAHDARLRAMNDRELQEYIGRTVLHNPSPYVVKAPAGALHADTLRAAMLAAEDHAPASVWHGAEQVARVDAAGRVTWTRGNPGRARAPRPGHDLPPGFPYPCKSPLVGTRVAGDDFAGEVIGCARGPRGKGTYLYVGGKAVSPAKIRGATKRSAVARAKLAERWSGLDYEPAPRPIRAPAQRPLGLPAPRSFTDCAPHVLAAQHGAILPPDVFAQCPEAEDAAERYAIQGEAYPARPVKGRKVRALRATLRRRASKPGRRGMAASPFSGQAIPYPEAYTFGAGTPERARWTWGAGGIEPGRPRAAAAPVQTSQEALAAKLRAMLGARFGSGR